ncbi:MAG: KOW domain-containing RNA-binding protein [Oscillospiraceae bacterium]|jgi:ribosomal protein L14E/L6E/L27E
MEIASGCVAKSIAGHDRGLYFVVIKVQEGYVYLANGKERKLEAVKRKNIRHISLTGKVIDLNEITNKKLRKLLDEFDTSVNNS